MNYLCCYCSKLFDVHDAIDGHKHGFKKGFLCPHCNENIDENRESILKDFVLVGMFLFIATCGLPGAGRRMGPTISLASITHKGSWVGLVSLAEPSPLQRTHDLIH